MAAQLPPSFDELIQTVATTQLTEEQCRELIRVLDARLPKQEEPVDVPLPPSPSGWLYAYLLPWVEVVVTDTQGGKRMDWALVKVGRSDPNNVQERIQREVRLLSGKQQRLKIKYAPSVPLLKPMTSKEYCDDAYAKWSAYIDLLFLFNCDVGREAEFRHYPTGVGIEVGTGRFSEQPGTMKLEWVQKNLKIKAKALRAWILGMPMTPEGASISDVTSESLGESEWVVMPQEVVDLVKTARVRSEAQYVDLMVNVRERLSKYSVQSVTLTLLGRSDHKSLTLLRPDGIEWPVAF